MSYFAIFPRRTGALPRTPEFFGEMKGMRAPMKGC
jgi:hypothetical protein